MGYSHYKKLRQVLQKFALKSEMIDLFPFAIKEVQPSDWLVQTLKLARMMPLTNEKTKSERIVSPILLETVLHFENRFTLFSGEELPVNSEDNLSGECDFFITLQRPSTVFEAPIISIVEAKDEDMEYGRAQCAAQLYGTKLYNEMEGKNFSVLFGCATDGIEWQFIRFDNNMFYIDSKVYTDLKEILGVWHHILSLYKNE